MNSPPMPADSSLQALRDASPRSRSGFEASIARYDALREQITAAPVPSPRKRPRRFGRRRVVGLSAVAATALALAGVIVALTVSATSPPSAFASAKRALAATAAAGSGTMTMTVTGPGGAIWTLESTRWNGSGIAITSGPRHLLGLNRQLLLIGGAAYLQTSDGTWMHYASESDVGPALAPDVQLAHDNVTGSTAEQILSLATDLNKAVRPDGTTYYTGTIPDSNADPVENPNDDAIIRMITNLRSGNAPGSPGGYHDGLQLTMTAGRDGLVRQITLSFRQHDSGGSTGLRTTTWNVTYSQLGSTPAIAVPPASRPTAR